VLTDVDGSIVVRLMGELDLSTVPGLEAPVGRVLVGRGGRPVVEARDLEFADSSAIALWVRCVNVGRFEMRDPSPAVR
jgi:anti-anti-sigma factor